MKQDAWKIWVDTGGTFTDCIATSPIGHISRLKVLSSSLLRLKVLHRKFNQLEVLLPIKPSKNFFNGFVVRSGSEQRTIINFEISTNRITLDKAFSKKVASVVEITSLEEVPVFAARILTETSKAEAFPPIEMKLGSTRGTNAILERKGAKTVLLVTKGFRDLLLIGNQQRENLFTLNIVKRAPLYDSVIEIDERILADGSILCAPGIKEIARVVNLLKKIRCDSIAVAFVNSYKNPAHELLMKSALLKSGSKFISLSHELSSQIKVLQRAETSVVNAYIEPLIHDYLNKIEAALKTANLKVMSSAGGLLDIKDFKPNDSLLSGPAGGVVGALARARQSNVGKIITFDMGGTSTDVSRCDGRPDYRFDCSVGNLKIFSPSLAIETIAAGGGSICHFDGYKLSVGPHSAGASPGPSCYGRGGPLTITDCNILLGRIDPDSFSIPLQIEEARVKFDEMIVRIGSVVKREDLLQSMIDIANEKMAEAIRKISVQQGHDPKEYALLSFGGAGGQHACSLAALLNINEIVIPYEAGLLSAYGIGHAKEERVKERLVLKNLADIENQLQALYDKLYQDAAKELHKSDPIITSYSQTRLIFLRLKGQETSLEIEVTSIENIKSDFIARYRKVYGHYLDKRNIEVESIRVIVSCVDANENRSTKARESYSPKTKKIINIYFSGSWKRCPLYQWEDLEAGASFGGPALVASQNSTVFVANGWSFILDRNQNATLKHNKSSGTATVRPGAASFELFTNRFTSLVEDMGTLLQRTSFSVNVKERLDFSCALLDSKGNLVVNAPHIPVHLGSLGVCVRSVLKVLPMEDGDVVITNHPGYGGSHLPDITLIKPVFIQGRIACFVVNRAHHAEVGGKKPGSMPADATTLEEEGVVISPTYLIRRGFDQWNKIDALLTGAVYPTRARDENLADLNAGLAALNLGEQSFTTMCEKFGHDEVTLYMRKLRSHATRLMKNKIQTLRKSYQALERLDDGTTIKVHIAKNQNNLTIDFNGSSGMHPGNLNATTAIVNSVVLYVLRLLLNESVPLNEGLLQPIKLVIPKGFLNPSFNADNKQSPAVVGGNTEVSQRITDTLLKAFGLSACSQGTMNNFLFGNEFFGYYETICGGTGAGPGFHGADAVHQHMTNTRITDPEILESRYPLILQRFEIRSGTGGKGKWNGGNGIIRELRFLQTLEVNILSQHRVISPYGMKGGSSGKVGEQYLIRGKKKIPLKGIDGIRVMPDDILVIKTPGGGGWGRK
ncbi:MAG: hydantoinase B/oxoprolinase family protein [Chryseolinea sp.]